MSRSLHIHDNLPWLLKTNSLCFFVGCCKAKNIHPYIHYFISTYIPIQVRLLIPPWFCSCKLVSIINIATILLTWYSMTINQSIILWSTCFVTIFSPNVEGKIIFVLESEGQKKKIQMDIFNFKLSSKIIIY